MKILDAIRRLFSNKFREAHQWPGPVIITTPPPELDRHYRIVSWCHRFNVRNRWIVPEKSPESIYHRAVKARKHGN